MACDVKTLVQWLSHDVLALAGPAQAERQGLYDFIVAEFRQRERLDVSRIRPVRTALEKQRDALLGELQIELAPLAKKVEDVMAKHQSPKRQ